METRRRRPLGVTIIAILEGIEAIILILASIGALVAANVAPHSAAVQGVPASVAVVGASVLVGVIGGALLFIGVLSLIFAWGLWTLKRWAFWLTIIAQVLSLVGSITQLTQGGSTGTAIGGMIIPVILLLYFLIDSNVRAAFRV